MKIYEKSRNFMKIHHAGGPGRAPGARAEARGARGEGPATPARPSGRVFEKITKFGKKLCRYSGNS